MQILSKQRVIAFILVILFTGIGIFLIFLCTQKADAYTDTYTLLSSMIATPTSPTSIVTQQFSNGGDISPLLSNSTILAAIITAVGAVVAALIMRSPRKRWNREKEPIPDEMESRPKTKEEYIQLYRKNFLADLSKKTVNIMQRHVNVNDIYVPLQLIEYGTYSKEEAVIDEMRTQRALEPEKAILSCPNRHCIFMGDPGAGKTTLLRHLAVCSAKQEELPPDLSDLPVYIELKHFASAKSSDLLDFVSTDWNGYGIPKELARKYITDNLDNGRNVLFLLDGLDETLMGKSIETAEKSYQKVVGAINQLAKKYSDTPIVVTTRKAVYRPSKWYLEGFTEMEMLDLRPEDIKKFVKNWFRQQRWDDARRLNDIIEHNSRILALATNPLLLTLILILYEKDEEIPERRYKIYKNCIEHLLNEWRKSRDITRYREFKLEHKRSLLEDVAWRLHTQRKFDIPYGELVESIKEFLLTVNIEDSQTKVGDTKGVNNNQEDKKPIEYRILREITSENGLLKEQAKDKYGFWHQTFQEYFVAEHISHLPNALDYLLEGCNDSWWEEVLLLYAEHIDISLLLQKLQEQDSRAPIKDDLFYTDTLFAGQCLAVSVRKPPQALKSIVASLFTIVRTTPYSFTRQQVIKILIEIGGQEVNLQLLLILTDERGDRNIRMDIASALSNPMCSIDEGDLLELLSKNIDTEIRILIAKSLGTGTRDSSSLSENFLPMIVNETIEKYVRGGIVDALGMMNIAWREDERPLVQQLVQSLFDERIHVYVREHIADTLGKIADSALAATLKNRLLDRHMRQYITDDIGEHIVYALGKLKDTSIIPDLLRCLPTQRFNTKVLVSIADTLGVLGNQETAKRLLDIFPQVRDPTLQGHIALAIGTAGEPSLIPKLQGFLSNSSIDTFVGESIIRTLSRLGARSKADTRSHVVRYLLQVLTANTMNERILICVADELGSLQDRLIAYELQKLLFESKIPLLVREAIVDTLGTLGERSVVPKLSELLITLTDPADDTVNLSLRGHIVTALVSLGIKQEPSLLCNMLSQEKLDTNLRNLIADKLSQFGDQSLVYDLVELLSKQNIDKTVRGRIAKTIEHLAYEEKTVYALADMLQASDIKDDIHRILWDISRNRNIGVRIFIKDQIPVVVPWRTNQ